MTRTRFCEFISGPEFGVASTLVFAVLYTWPFLTFDRASSTFRFIFVAWCLHIALIGLRSCASRRSDEAEPGTAGRASLPPTR